jgi:hypothetical protein
MAQHPAPDDEVFNQSPPFVGVNLFTSARAPSWHGPRRKLSEPMGL